MHAYHDRLTTCIHARTQVLFSPLKLAHYFISGYYAEGKGKNHPLIGIAVCASFKVIAAARGRDDVVPGQEACDFYLTWHMPRVHFRSALVAYRRCALFFHLVVGL